MEVKTKKVIAREILFFVKMAVPTAIIVLLGGGLYQIVEPLGGMVMAVGGSIYPITVLVRLFNWVFNWAKETVKTDE